MHNLARGQEIQEDAMKAANGENGENKVEDDVMDISGTWEADPNSYDPTSTEAMLIHGKWEASRAGGEQSGGERADRREASRAEGEQNGERCRARKRRAASRTRAAGGVTHAGGRAVSRMRAGASRFGGSPPVDPRAKQPASGRSAKESELPLLSVCGGSGSPPAPPLPPSPPLPGKCPWMFRKILKRASRLIKDVQLMQTKDDFTFIFTLHLFGTSISTHPCEARVKRGGGQTHEHGRSRNAELTPHPTLLLRTKTRSRRTR
jgi:hypothetical protein